MKSFFLEYVGNATVDKRLSNPMVPWVSAQIRKGTGKKSVWVRVEGGGVVAREDGRTLFTHSLQQVSRLSVVPGPNSTMTLFYAVRQPDGQLLICHLFQSTEPEQVMELVNEMKEESCRLPAATSSTALCPDISPSSSQFFEVLYIGKIKVSHRKVPESFIDDALDKFNNLDKFRRQQEFNYSQDSEGDSGVTTSSKFGSTETLKDSQTTDQLPNGLVRKRSGSAGSVLILKKPETLSLAAESRQQREEHNRTMVFHVGRSDLRLISPDRKQVLLHKLIRDILTCLQGAKHNTHFAFVCKEAGIEQPHYIGYVFKCQSQSVAADVVTAITQALGCGKKDVCKNGTVMSCEHCPLVWYHKLCHELEAIGHDPPAQVSAVMKRVHSLPEEEQFVVEMKLKGGAQPDSTSDRERLELLMMLLRAHCEAKQSTHVHDTPHPRNEFLNHYLGGGTIFMKAKRSLTNSFDQLLKRKGSRDDLANPSLHRGLSLPPNSILPKEDLNTSVGCESSESSDLEEKNGPMKNIFMKVGCSSPGGPNVSGNRSDDSEEEERPASWRQAIFNTVVTPSKAQPEFVVKKDKEFYRSLWKKAINQQVLLIRMERENARLTARQEEANVKRIKLEYDDLGCQEVSPFWDQYLAQASCISSEDSNFMAELTQGIPRSKRGEVWLSLASRHPSKSEPFDSSAFPNFDVPYESLLKQLTCYQHAILIDLGRTFPSHKYFSSPLGPGQLALFNLLKAYSLLDPDVGYCQGLSFISAILLLHMSESESFQVLKEVMVVRGLRARYLPDMAALQVQLYQLSRLLLDTYPALYKHLDKHDVTPTLYAAPWLLTLFSSQFPLGFVARVFDVMLGDSTNVLFKIAVALLGEHKKGLLACDSFEAIMDYLKKDLPQVDQALMDKIMSQVLMRDVSRELREYGVEYHVLQEEMQTPRPETKKLRLLEEANQALQTHNNALSEQLQIANSNINRLESSRSSHMSQINKLETQVKGLESTVSVLADFVSLVVSKGEMEVPGEVARAMASLGRRAVRSAPLRVIQDEEEPKVVKEKESLSAKMQGLLDRVAPTGRILSDKERESLLARRPRPLRPTQSSFELNTKPLVPMVPPQPNGLPLDSNGVHISFEGTTKLRTIRSRNSMNTIHPPPPPPTQLKIIEKSDEVTDKLKATLNKVTTLFDSTNNRYDKSNSVSDKFVNSLSKEGNFFNVNQTVPQKS